jgi:hypothetical protein
MKQENYRKFHLLAVQDIANEEKGKNVLNFTTDAARASQNVDPGIG